LEIAVSSLSSAVLTGAFSTAATKSSLYYFQMKNKGNNLP